VGRSLVKVVLTVNENKGKGLVARLLEIREMSRNSTRDVIYRIDYKWVMGILAN